MDQDVINLAKAIRQKESGGNFDAVGDNGTSRGAYQWQESTWKQHAKEVLGDENAQMTPSNQNAVAYAVMKKDKDNGLNPAQIAAKWNSGSPYNWENKIGYNSRVGVNYNVPKYVKDVTDLYQQMKSQVHDYTKDYNISNTQYNQADKQQRIEQGQPISVREDRAEPTMAGEVVRGLAKVPVEILASLISGGKGLLGKDTKTTIKSKYLGDVTDMNTQIKEKGKKLADKYKKGDISLGRALVGGAAAGAEKGIDLATFLPVGGAAKAGVTAATEGIAPQILSKGTAKLLGEGALLGGGQNLSEQLASGEKVKGGEVLSSAALGGGLNVAGGALLPKALKQIAPAQKVAQNEASAIAQDIARGNKTEQYVAQAVKEGRYTSPTTFASEKIAPSVREQNIADAVEPLIINKELNPAAPIEKQTSQLDNKVNEINRELKNIIRDNNAEVSTNDFYNKIQEKRVESAPVFAKDPANQAAYDALLNKYLDFLGGDNSILSHFEARQKFDKWMKKELPDVVRNFTNQKGQDIRANAYDDIRTAINELVAEKLPPNNPFRDQLMREHYLLSAKSNLEGKLIEKSLKGGSSKAGDFLKTKIGKGLLGGGTGAGLLSAYFLGKSND